MALRLILVGVVASLALDLPRGDVRPVATRAIRSILVAEPARHAADAGQPTLIADEPQFVQANPPLATQVPIKPTVAVATIRPTVTVEPSLPVAAPELAATAVPPIPLPVELALLPTLDDAAPAPALMPMPMPPVLEVASAPVSPTAGAVPAPALAPAPAPIPTTVAVAPMTPPSAIVVELSPEAAPAPAPAVAESEQPAPADPDAAFRKIVATMASTFAADLPAAAPAAEPKPLVAQAEPTPVAAPAPAAEEVVAQALELDLYPGVAFALNREAEGISPIEAMARAEPTPTPVPVAEPSRAERLSQAVKLTGQALDAWAGLLSQRTPSSAVQR